jgi:hypothetical protein
VLNGWHVTFQRAQISLRSSGGVNSLSNMGDARSSVCGSDDKAR